MYYTVAGMQLSNLILQNICFIVQLGANLDIAMIVSIMEDTLSKVLY